MDAMTRKALDAARDAFRNRAGQSDRVDHVLVVYPEWTPPKGEGELDFLSAERRARVGLAWPPEWAMPWPRQFLRTSAGLLKVCEGAWLSGLAGPATEAHRLYHLAQTAGVAFKASLKSSPALGERFAFRGWHCMDDPADSWLLAIHCLGWRPIEGSPLRGGRYTWHSGRPLSMEALRKRANRQRRAVQAASLTPGTQRIQSQTSEKRLIGHPYFSTIGPDLFYSSVLAIDAILSFFDAAQTASVATLPPAEPSPPTAASEQKARARKRQYEWVPRYMALAVEHPDWTDTRLADALGISRQTISRAARTHETVRRIHAARTARTDLDARKRYSGTVDQDE